MTKQLLLLLSIFAISGCGLSHRYKAAQIDNDLIAGQYQNIIKKTLSSSDIEKINTNEHGILDSLNGGTALFFMNENKTAQSILDYADKQIETYFLESVAKFGSREIISTLGNDSIFDYQPMVMDNIYLSTYKILNYLALGDKEGARIEVNRGYDKQQSASVYFGAEIEKANNEAAKELHSLDTENQKLWNNSKDVAISKYYADLEKWHGYKNYMNPYTTYLSGLFFMTNGKGSSDYETASTYMRRVVGMVPQNSFVRKDLIQAESLANFQARNNKFVWVIYENGMVAEFEEERLDIPAFIVTRTISFVSFSLPKPKLRWEAFPNLYINYGKQQNIRTEILADVDSMFIAEFNRKLPALITKAVSQAITKAIIQYAAYQQDDSGWASLAATLYTLTTSSADLRSWHTLPKNVQIAKIKIEKNEDLIIQNIDGVPIGEVKVPTDTNSIVYIRIPSIMSKPIISVIKL